MVDSTEIEITFTLKTRRRGVPTQAQGEARGLIVDMREAIIASEHNRYMEGSPHDWVFDIVGESFKITDIEKA